MLAKFCLSLGQLEGYRPNASFFELILSEESSLICVVVHRRAEHIERVDCLVRRIARQQGLQSDTLDEIVALVDERLEKNRSAARV